MFVLALVAVVAALAVVVDLADASFPVVPLVARVISAVEQSAVGGAKRRGSFSLFYGASAFLVQPDLQGQGS